MRKLLAVVLALLVPLGCTPNYSQHTYLTLNNIKEQRVAVLPFANETVDFDASPVFRYAVHNYLVYKGYKVIPNVVVDRLLSENNVREGGELTAFSPQELGEILQADLLLYGTITEFNTKYALVYSSIQVECEFKLVETQEGKKVWDGTSGSYSNNFSRIFFVGNLIDLLLTLNVKGFITDNDFVRLFKKDYSHILSESYLRNNVERAQPPTSSAEGQIGIRAQVNLDPQAGRAIMSGAKAGVDAIKGKMDDKRAMVVMLIIFLTWTLLYAIFDNYNNYVVETVVKGFDDFPGFK